MNPVQPEHLAPKSELRISVVIPSLNEGQLIRQTIQSAIDSLADEIIVSDGGSHDTTLEIAHKTGCRVVHSEKGRGSQLAEGADLAGGDVIIFLHADSRLSADCLDQIRQKPPNSEWGCFEQVIEAAGRRFRWLERGNGWRAEKRKMVYGDQAMWVTREAYQSSGGFQPVPIMEDVMISDALRKSDGPLLLPGPVFVSARHWQGRGVVWSTVRNWLVFGLFRCGISPRRIARLYR